MAKSQKMPILLCVFLLTLIVTVGLFAYAYTTDTTTLSITGLELHYSNNCYINKQNKLLLTLHMIGFYLSVTRQDWHCLMLI